jgi:hypothetical protein
MAYFNLRLYYRPFVMEKHFLSEARFRKSFSLFRQEFSYGLGFFAHFAESFASFAVISFGVKSLKPQRMQKTPQSAQRKPDSWGGRIYNLQSEISQNGFP